MATVKHRVEYWATKFGFGLVNMMSAETANSFGRFLGSVFGRLLPKRKKIAIDNLRHAFKESKTDLEYDKIAGEVFENIGQAFFELARFNKITHADLNEMITCKDVSPFQKAQDEEKGAIVVTSHFGSWELTGAWVVANGFQIDVVAKVQTNHLIDDLINQLRKKLQHDMQGKGTVISALEKALLPVMTQVLTINNTTKIRQHYVNIRWGI